MKLLDLLSESMADGGAFKAFVDKAVAKKEIQTNEDVGDLSATIPGNGLAEDENELSNDDLESDLDL